ncbi:oligosaccharide flippase family protein [candidate division KSB3 bacterium]|uniref:Oligosaccharide flippase family protein n=1 Tax=candidate division KSB3 bacterium TaxID=2044937 RepID=A0A9D5JUE8_9BACT|nr:oligosaccharide flippase family protein [candidate division KSB3 bacterium]MBD3324295.1 oligosaccharide flippase family protein [candidate division KSB3 bacterium]
MLFRILRNILSLLTSQFISKLFSLFCVIYLARELAVEQFGLYGVGMAYLTLFAALADGGMSTVTIRDVAQDHTRSDEYFAHVLVLRGLLTVGAYGLMLGLGSVWQSSDFPPAFIALCGVFLFPEAIRKLGVSMLSAYERMDLVAVLDVLSIVLRYLPFFGAIFLGQTLQIAFVLLAGVWMGVAGIWALVTRKYCLTRWKAPINPAQLWHILYESFPFGILFFLTIVYFKADIIMLSKMQGEIAVGFYEGAYKFIEASMFIPVSIVHVLLPVMSRTFVADKASYNKVFLHSTRILALSILPVCIGVSFFAQEIILLVYGEAYLPSAPALALLIWALFFIFLNAPVGNIISTSKMIHAFLPYAIGNMLANIGLNLLLIPHYSFLGASFTTLFTECTGFAIQLWFANRILGNAPEILGIVGRLLIAGAGTSGVFWMTRSLVLFPLNVLLALGVYLVLLLLLRVISQDDRRLVGELLRQARAKLA